MSWSRRIFTALALVVAGALALMVTRQQQLTPAEQLGIYEARVARREQYSEGVLLSGLLSVAEQAAERGEPDVAARALVARGKLLLELGSGALARDDFERALREFRPGDLEIRRLVASAWIATGELESALADLETLLADVPHYSPAWIQAGELRRAMAAERVARAAELLSRAFTREGLARARPLLERLAAQDPSDLRRPANAARLRELGAYRESEIVARALVLLDAASAQNARARAAFARSLELEVAPAAFAGLAQILVEAGELEAAVELGRVALRQPAVARHLPTLGVLLRANMQRGDMRSAAHVARNLLALQSVDLDLLLAASRAFYETRDFPRLLGPDSTTLRLRQISDRHTAVAELYMGLVVARGAEPGRALMSLRNFATSDVEEPFPGARLLAWTELAGAAARSGDRFAEREALFAAVQLAPEADASLWRRLSELQAEGGGASSDLPLASLSQALRLAPRSVPELLPRWRELGERTLAEGGIDLAGEFELLASRGQTLPLRQLEPYPLFRVAELWAEAGDPARVRLAIRPLLEDLPGFLPALDLALWASLELGRMPEALEQIVVRAEAVGLDERTRELLDLVPEERFSSGQILRLMEAAPGRVGRRRFAERLRSEGWPERALASLEGGAARGDARAQALAAEILLQAGEYSRAATLAAQVPAADPASRPARRTALLASLRQPELGEVHGLVAETLAAGGPSPAEALHLAQLLSSFGEPELARDLLAPLDSPDGARSEELFVALSIAELLRDDAQAARFSLARAEYFARSSRPVLGRLFVLAQGGDWDALAPLAGELRSQERVPSLREGLLALLEGRPDEAAAIAGELAAAGQVPEGLGALLAGLARFAAAPPAEEGAPGEPDPADDFGLRQLALGSPDAPRDPRQMATLLLALESPPFAPLARRELRGLLRAFVGRPWVLYLRARADLALGDRASARRALETLTRGTPHFRPAWSELGELFAGTLAEEHPERVAFEDLRRTVEAARGEDDLGARVARAELLLARGDAEAALRSARDALELAPRSSRALSAQAAALAALGDPLAALESRRRATMTGSAAEARACVPALLAALREGQRSAPPTLPRAKVELELDLLRERFPDDPLVVLAQAELDLRGEAVPGLATWTRARARLAAFRERHVARPLEDLRPGSSVRWGELLLEFDPAAALSFVEAEMRLDPSHLGLRVFYARALRSAGEAERALAGLDSLARMVVDPRVEFERAACMVAKGAPLNELEQQFSKVRGLRESRGPMLELEVLRARSRVQAGPEPRGELLDELERFWRAGEALLRQPAGAELAYLYALHLALGDPRSEPPGMVDLPLLREVLAALEGAGGDPYRAACLASLPGLAGPGAVESPLATDG